MSDDTAVDLGLEPRLQNMSNVSPNMIKSFNLPLSPLLIKLRVQYLLGVDSNSIGFHGT